jgi:hypothetical protein
MPGNLLINGSRVERQQFQQPKIIISLLQDQVLTLEVPLGQALYLAPVAFQTFLPALYAT